MSNNLQLKLDDASRDDNLASLFSDLLSKDLRVKVTVTGESMHPYIKNGDTVVIQKIDASDLHRGDIILCKTDGDVMLLHRLLRKHIPALPHHLQTKGDAINRLDEPVSIEHVMGRVTSIQRSTESCQLQRNIHSPFWRSVNWLYAVYQGTTLLLRKLFS